MNEHYIKLGNLIKEKRLEKELSTQELANILDVSIGFLNNLENAKTDTFNVELMLKLHNTLEISLFNFVPISDNDLSFSRLSSLEQPENFHDNISNILSNNIDSIINKYINTIKKYNFDPIFIDNITNKLIQELNYISNFKLK